MRSAEVFYKDELAGSLTQNDDGSFVFRYSEKWLNNSSKPSISLTLPKSKIEFQSDQLFPFFYHLLPEGVNKRIVCRNFKIDENDVFGILLHTARTDTIGAITIKRSG